MTNTTSSSERNTAPRIPGWLWGGIFGMSFYLIVAGASSIVLDFGLKCFEEFYRLNPGSLSNPCFPPMADSLVLASIRGPSSFVWSVLPQWIGYSLSTLIYALIGAISFRTHGPRRGLVNFLIAFVVLLAPSFCFTLAFAYG